VTGILRHQLFPTLVGNGRDAAAPLDGKRPHMDRNGEYHPGGKGPLRMWHTQFASRSLCPSRKSRGSVLGSSFVFNAESRDPCGYGRAARYRSLDCDGLPLCSPAHGAAVM